MFTVLWTSVAEHQLIAVVQAAADPDAVIKAARKIERDLRRDPMEVGESRESGVSRVVFAKPLGLAFNVIVDDQTVYVTAVWAIR